ncbi:Asp23/Gls24 family envelope stress response protein [Acidipropionibacterium timonense]|uniref:Asp23/Gls24 family envelope stress response protein n=1 Tax=Acidipropionibacterium timonense TaxID=2161818 RepID=UPI00102F7A06|nr:Asp23/Gls24 family envelope stress response protein [Acidipropionibacterium timonense]
MTAEGLALAGRRRSVPSLVVHDRGKADRGSLTVTAAVVEKVAAMVASEVDGLGAPSGGLLRRWDRADYDRGPVVTARLVGDVADLTVAVAVTFPTPVEPACDELRERLVTRVPRLSGVELRVVDIVVTTVSRHADEHRELS